MASAFPEGLSVDALARFGLLRDRFVLGLPARWHAISTAPTQMARHDALHRLAGSAGSYGFDDLGQLAREAEKILATGDSAKLGTALALLQNALDAAAAGVPRHPGQTPASVTVL